MIDATFLPADPIVEVTIPPGNPWLLEYLARDGGEFVSLVADFLPGGVGPDGYLGTRYAERRRSGLVTGYVDEEHLRRGCELLATLAQSMANNGFQRGRAWNGAAQRAPWMIGRTEWYGGISFGVRDDGRLEHHDGRHRTALAHLLGLDLPSRIVARQHGWDRVVKSMGCSPQYDVCDHPDLSFRPTVRRDSPRFDRAAAWMATRVPAGDRVVEVGAHCGRFAASLGGRYELTLIEPNPVYAAVCRATLTAHGETATFAASLDAAGPASAVVAFSSLQHLARTPEQLERILRLITARFDFALIEAPVSGEPIWGWQTPDPTEMIREAFSGWETSVLFVDRCHLDRRTIGYSRRLPPGGAQG